MTNLPQENSLINLPVKISYETLEVFLKKKLEGEEIKKTSQKSSSYARILDLSLASSREENYDLAVDVKFKTLTSFFKNREGNILLDIAFEFDPETQQVFVRDYKFDLKSNSWLMDNSLETIVNSFLYEKLKKKMSFDFRPLIEKQLNSLNGKLEEPLEAIDGIFLSGFLLDFKIKELLPGDKLLLVFVELEAKALVEVKKIDF